MSQVIRESLIQLEALKCETIAEQMKFYDRMQEIRSTTSDVPTHEYIDGLISKAAEQCSATLDRIDFQIDRCHQLLS